MKIRVCFYVPKCFKPKLYKQAVIRIIFRNEDCGAGVPPLEGMESLLLKPQVYPLDDGTALSSARYKQKSGVPKTFDHLPVSRILW
jgi:hypothetical protein